MAKPKKRKKKTSRVRKVIITICIIVLVIALIVTGLYFWNGYKANQLYNDTIENYVVPLTSDEVFTTGNDELDDIINNLDVIDFDGLKYENEDVCAWIQIPAIPDINYPVVHYTDNDYYLRRSLTGEYSVSGTIFMDCNCSPDFTDLHTIIYGHNMTTGPFAGTMFGQLKKFQDQTFFDNNSDYVIIYTPERTLIYQIFSVHVVNKDTPGIYMVGFERNHYYQEFIERLNSLTEVNTGTSASIDNDVLTLSTCSGVSGTSDRLNVNCKLVAEVKAENTADNEENETEMETETEIVNSSGEG